MTEGPPAFPFPHPPGPRPPRRFAELTAEPDLPRVQLSSGLPALLVTRYAQVRAVLSDDRFSRATVPSGPLFARSKASLALVTSDPPVHNRRRQAVALEFTARRAREMAPRLRELAAEGVARLRTLPQPADLLEEYTVPFALRTSTEQLGLSYDEAFGLRPAMAAMMSVGSRTPEQVAAAHAHVHAYFAAQVARRRADIDAGRPQDDLLTRLLTGPAADRLDSEEVTVFGAGLLMAGFDTTANQLAMTALMVFRDPALAARLRAHPEEVAPAIEEVLRWSSLIATGGAAHIALEDVQLGDVLIPAGEIVVPVPSASNQDAAFFADPDRFDPQRQENPHMAFGHGRHYCLGAPLARQQLQIGLSMLLEGFPELSIAVPEDEVQWSTGQFIRGPLALPVRWDERARPDQQDDRPMARETADVVAACPYSPASGTEQQ
jgi:cytochrome P450